MLGVILVNMLNKAMYMYDWCMNFVTLICNSAHCARPVLYHWKWSTSISWSWTWLFVHTYQVWARGSHESLPTFSMQNFWWPLLPVMTDREDQ